MHGHIIKETSHSFTGLFTYKLIDDVNKIIISVSIGGPHISFLNICVCVEKKIYRRSTTELNMNSRISQAIKAKI